jgi:hypothetical protein
VTTPYKRPNIEVADIFRYFGNKIGKLSKDQWKAVNAIKNCRTGALGGHLLQCGSCDFKSQAYNSCRNRHCPKCQFTARTKWVEARTEDLLPCQYFHVVFTVPSELRALMYANKEVTYDLLFKASSETLKEVAKRHLKADIGFFGVLHTRSQSLEFHPHVHFVVPGGGLTKGKDQWVPCHQDYLLPIKILSDVFRVKLIEKLEELYNKNELKFLGSTEQLSHPGLFRDFVIKLQDKEFVVYCKKPFSGPKAVILYLGGYTHRIAISNHRLVKLEDDKVFFKVRSRKDPEVKQTTSLSAGEFMRRFLMHVLPRGFTRIRHYGVVSGRVKSKNSELIRKLCKVSQRFKARLEETAGELFRRVTGKEPNQCPACEAGRLEMSLSFRSILSSA